RDNAIQGIIVVMIHHNLTEEAQFPTRLGKRQNRDGVSIDIAQPTHLGLGLDREERTFDVNIVSLARSEQRLVGTERDRGAVMIFRFMCYADALYRQGRALSF